MVDGEGCREANRQPNQGARKAQLASREDGNCTTLQSTANPISPNIDGANVPATCTQLKLNQDHPNMETFQIESNTEMYRVL